MQSFVARIEEVGPQGHGPAVGDLAAELINQRQKISGLSGDWFAFNHQCLIPCSSSHGSHFFRGGSHDMARSSQQMRSTAFLLIVLSLAALIFFFYWMH
jgi:hypothetical protein